MSNPNYIKFGPQEMIVQFATDRGELKTNENGDYFFRGFADRKRFCCASPELEQRLKEINYHAGEQVGIARLTRNRIVIWRVRLIEPATPEAPRPAPRPVEKRTPPPIPPAKYAAPPPVEWPETQTPAKPARIEAPRLAPVTPGRLDSPLGRCLCEALDACKIAQEHAAKIGLPTIFGAEQVEKIGVSIFIERTRNGSYNDRKPANRETGRTNGVADAWSN